MLADASELMRFMRAIDGADNALTAQMLAADPSLARRPLEPGATRQTPTDFFLDRIKHYVYGGDTALHVAAATYQVDTARALVSAGADVSARNRRGAQPLHYAADSSPADSHWNPPPPDGTIAYLIRCGADPDATDKSGVAPLHRFQIGPPPERCWVRSSLHDKPRHGARGGRRGTGATVSSARADRRSDALSPLATGTGHR